MVNCELCPVQEECAESREQMLEEHDGSMQPFVWSAIENCPLADGIAYVFKQNIGGIKIV